MGSTENLSGAWASTRTTRVEKVRGDDRERIESLIVGESRSVRRAFREFMRNVQSPRAVRDVRSFLERGDVEGALEVVGTYVSLFGRSLYGVFTAGGSAEVAALAAGVAALVGDRVASAISFDPSHPRAAEVARRSQLQLVREFTEGQREATRSAVRESLMTGAGTVQTARAFRDSIGLAEHQLRAVANYRRLLEAGDAAALQRDLRDRRFDSSVRRAVEDDQPLGAARTNRMVDRYRERYLQYRAEVISRTETMRTLALARQEALEQIVEQAGIPRESVVRIWQATKDRRTRDTHEDLDDQRRGLDEPFVSSSGARLMYPGDPAAPAAEVINCRCVVLHEFVDLQNI